MAFALVVIGCGLIIFAGIYASMQSIEKRVWNNGVCDTTNQHWTVTWNNDHYLLRSGAVVRTIRWLNLEYAITPDDVSEMVYLPSDRKAVLAVLKGDESRLIDAFDWKSTPQGEQYWNARWESKVPISSADRNYLTDLVW